eukprot:6209127-Prymnesium_polylepis.1
MPRKTDLSQTSFGTTMLPTLPTRAYYRAGTLGEGSFGAVCCVYDDEGNEFAAKVPARHPPPPCLVARHPPPLR